MSHPFGRLGNYYEEAARKSTLDYILYCHKRLCPHGKVDLHCDEEPKGGEFRCVIACVSVAGENFVVRFNVPIEANGANILLLAKQAHEHMARMLQEVNATK